MFGKIYRGLNSGLIFTLFLYQLVVIVYQFQGALEFYYFHLGLVQMVVMGGLCVQLFSQPTSLRRNLRLFFYNAILVLGLAASTYLYINVNDIEMRQPFLESADIWAGVALIATVTLQVYFVWGRVLAALILLSMLYFAFGYLVPGRFHYESPELEILVSYLAGMGGARGVIWGIPLSANTLFLVIVFGGLMKGARVLELFNEIGKILLNVARGGTCYSAILASTAIGMVTGQAVANIALSGSVTIPAMQQRGLAKTRAGAVEVVASLGSQLIPPIMGLGGFLIAVNLGIPYSNVATAAIMPAILFIAILFITTFFMAEAETSLQTQREDVDCSILPVVVWRFNRLVVFSLFPRLRRIVGNSTTIGFGFFEAGGLSPELRRALGRIALWRQLGLQPGADTGRHRYYCSGTGHFRSWIRPRPQYYAGFRGQPVSGFAVGNVYGFDCRPWSTDTRCLCLDRNHHDSIFAGFWFNTNGGAFLRLLFCYLLSYYATCRCWRDDCIPYFRWLILRYRL